MPNTPVHPPGQSPPAAPYSPGIDTGQMVFVAGQVPLDANGQTVGAGDLGAQTRQVIRNVENVLKAAGASLADVVSTTVYVPSFDGFEVYNEAYAEAFGSTRPARATVQAGLARPEWLLEMQAIAVKSA